MPNYYAIYETILLIENILPHYLWSRVLDYLYTCVYITINTYPRIGTIVPICVSSPLDQPLMVQQLMMNCGGGQYLVFRLWEKSSMKMES